MKLRSDAKNELTDRLRQKIGHRVTATRIPCRVEVRNQVF